MKSTQEILTDVLFKHGLKEARDADNAKDKNEETAQAFNAQVKKEHEAVFAFITKKGIKPL